MPVLIYSAVCLLAFVTLRRRCSRVYSARTLSSIRPPTHLSQSLPRGWVDWLKPFFFVPERFILNHSSLDAFLFLRYLKVLGIICFAGVVCVWPILLPLHGTGGRKLSELDLLTIGNVAQATKFYAHVVVAWAFFGFILYMISRECMYYINLRQAYLLSPQQANHVSSRTVLFTSVPERYLSEKRIQKLFGESVQHVWIPRNTKALRSMVKERYETAVRLEKAEIELIKLVNATRNKQLQAKPRKLLDFSGAIGLPIYGKKAKSPSQDELHEAEETSSKDPEGLEVAEKQQRSPLSSPGSSTGGSTGEKWSDPEYTHPYGLDKSLPDVNGSVAARFIPHESRPTHRPLANFGRKVDTIKWTRSRIKTLNRQIARLRRQHRSGRGAPINAVFVEFDSQVNAQAAYQIVAHHQPLHMSPRYIGIRPEEIVWNSLRMKWWERPIRRFLMMGAIAAGVIFWSIPSALVGTISNVEFLSTKIFFLKWIASLPGVITGVIQGLLPALALSLLMAMVPVMLRACARFAGTPSLSMVELFVQHAYFIFQVVQVFLITTLTSAASAAFTKILEDPLSAKDLLSENLPKASNFYLSYILVQCLAAGANGLVHLLELFRHEVIARFSDDLRLRHRRYHKLRVVHWGAIYPVFTNMAVIAISYSCIAPLILVFAGLGMCFSYMVYKYNLLYVFDTELLDSRGLYYPRALMHLMVGLYLAEICMIGLFALQSAFVPLILMVMFLVFTGLVHISLNEAVSPLLYNLPRTLALESEELEQNDHPGGTGGPLLPEEHAGGAAASYYDVEEAFEDEEDTPDNNTLDRSVEGSRGLMSFFTKFTRTAIEEDLNAQAQESGLTAVLTKINRWITPDPNKVPNFFMRWLHPEIYEDFKTLRQLVDQMPPEEDATDKLGQRAYWPPEMWLPAPKLWIPRDEGRVSRQEVAHTREVIQITDRGAWLNEKNRVVADFSATPYEEERVMIRFW